MSGPVLPLGLPDMVASPGLSRRFAWITAARLVLLTLALALVGLFYLRGGGLGSLTLRIGLVTLVVSFALAGLYALVLRTGKGLFFVADAQLVLDPIAWTVVAYLTGGASSGAASFYGLSCLVGALLTGFRGAAIAAVSGVVAYSTMVLLLATNVLEPPHDQPLSLYVLSWDEVRFHLAVNALVQLVVALLSGSLAERLRATGGELAVAKERAERAEHMALLGRLAAGLAHEIRNPLGSIAGSVQLLKAAGGLSEDDRALCEIIQREAGRLNDLVTDMMDLSRPRRPEMARIDVARLVREVVELAGKSGRGVSDVAITYEGPESARVLADGAQLRQLVWNLVRNGVQASSAGDRVVVSLAPRSEKKLELAVRDRGVGIAPEARGRLFDAFFTTRSHGTGVGLAVVKRIADEHGFALSVDSGTEKGAVFRLTMPSADDDPPA
ncbi:MAG TPA: ATP-binding protein [Polyangiaceae bacterium]|nr:ATP-binding protein [Polyangiaceae bacterium]